MARLTLVVALVSLCVASQIVGGVCKAADADPVGSDDDGVGVSAEELAREEALRANRQKTPIHGSDYYPLDITVVKTSALMGPPAAGCFNAMIHVEHDCTEAKTCGCQSAVLSVVVAGELQVLESRLDEISNVFEPDLVQLNLTLCDLAVLLGTKDTGAGGGLHNAEAGYHFVEVEATLRHGSSKELMAALCRSISRSGEARECEGTHEERMRRRTKGDSVDGTSSVKVQGVQYGNSGSPPGLDRTKCSEDGRCGKVHLALAREAYKRGAHDEALRILNAVAAYGEGSEALPEDNAWVKRRAALERMALLPPFALTGKCCDSVNAHCAGIDHEEMLASDTFWERELLKLVGTDQCEGSFVEVGGGDGVTDSMTLYMEKVMGWRGLILEGNGTLFETLRHSGRQANKTHAYVAGAAAAGGAGVDLRQEMERHFDMHNEEQTVQLVVINEVGPSQLDVIRALNTSMALGQYGMPVPLCSMFAVTRDTANTDTEELSAILEAKAYHKMSADSADKNAAAGIESRKGRVYDFYLWMPSMEEMQAAGVDIGPGPTSEEGADEDAEAWDGKPEIEYHVSDDEDDEDSDE